MNLTDVRAQAWAMPLSSPIYPRGPYRFINREVMVITIGGGTEEIMKELAARQWGIV